MLEAMQDYVERVGITVAIGHDYGIQLTDGGEAFGRWEHHKYDLLLSNATTGEQLETPWAQGVRVEESPTDTPADVLDALVGEAQIVDQNNTFEAYAEEFDYNPDSRSAYRRWERMVAFALKLDKFLGPGQLTYLVENVERL